MTVARFVGTGSSTRYSNDHTI